MIFCVFVRILAGVLIEGYLAATIRLKVSGCSLAPSLNVPEIADALACNVPEYPAGVTVDSRVRVRPCCPILTGVATPLAIAQSM